MQFCLRTVKYKNTVVLFQAIQFSISTQFKRQKQLYFKQFSLV